MIKLLADDLQRQVLIALKSENISQASYVIVGESSITARSSRRNDKTFGFQKSNLADGDIWKVTLEQTVDLANAQRALVGRLRRLRRTHVPGSTPTKKTKRNFPTCTSSPPLRR